MIIIEVKTQSGASFVNDLERFCGVFGGVLCVEAPVEVCATYSHIRDVGRRLSY